MEDRPPPRSLVTPRTALRAAWVLIAAGLAVLALTPWTPGSRWTLTGGIMIFVGLGIDWRARTP